MAAVRRGRGARDRRVARTQGRRAKQPGDRRDPERGGGRDGGGGV